MASTQRKTITVWGKSLHRGLGAEFLVRAPEAECPREAAFWPFLGVFGTKVNHYINGRFAVTGKPKLALCTAAWIPKPQSYGRLPTFRQGLQLPPAPLVYALAVCIRYC